MFHGNGLLIGELACGAYIFVALCGFVFTVRNCLQARASSKWPSVGGTIVTSKVTEQFSGDGPGSPTLKVRYEYVVNGRHYVSTKAGFGAPFSAFDKYHLRRLRKRHQRGKSVTVYYNPQTPEVAVLQTGNDGLSLLGPVICLFLMLAGIIVFSVVLSIKH